MSTQTELATADQDLLHRFYYQIRLIQELDKCLSGKGMGQPVASLLLPTTGANGAEVCDVGVLNAIDETKDHIFSACRADVHSLIHSDDVSAYLARLCATREPERCVEGARIQTNSLPSAAAYQIAQHRISEAMNTALTDKLTHSEAVSIVILQQGAIAPAQLRHYLDVCFLWSLPILFVVSSLAEAGGSPMEAIVPAMCEEPALENQQLATYSIKANDVLKVYAFTAVALAYVRTVQRPLLLELLLERDERPAGDRLHSAAPNVYGTHEALGKVTKKLSAVEQERIEYVIRKRIEVAWRTVQWTNG